MRRPSRPRPLHGRAANSRRRALAALAIGPLAAVALAACGDDDSDTADTAPTTTVPSSVAESTTTPSTSAPDSSPPTTDAPDPAPPSTESPGSTPTGDVDYPRDPSVPVLRLELAGGFVPWGVDFARVPSVLITGDGRSFAEGVTTQEFPGPLVRPVTVRTISDAAIRELLARADDAGLLGPAPDYSGGNVTDHPDTVLTITTTEGTFVHRAYALEYEEDDDSAARAALREFVDALSNLEETVGADELGDETLLEPETYRVQAIAVTEEQLASMEEEPTVVGWPDETGVLLRDIEECAVVAASAVGELFADAKENTLFSEGDGETATLYQLAARADLPGDRPCSGSTDSGGIDYPQSAQTAVLRVTFEGGLVPPGFVFTELPAVLVSGDGRAFSGGVTTQEYPGPLVRPVVVRTISDEAIRDLLARADAAGLLGPAPDYTGAENVADAPETVLTITTNDRTFEHRAYGLGLESGTPSAARQALADFVALLEDLEGTVGADQLGEESPFVPEVYRIRSMPVEEDVLVVEPEPSVVPWPLELDVRLADASDCAALPADAVGDLLTEERENTVFTEGDAGETATYYQLFVRPELPGDPPC